MRYHSIPIHPENAYDLDIDILRKQATRWPYWECLNMLANGTRPTIFMPKGRLWRIIQPIRCARFGIQKRSTSIRAIEVLYQRASPMEIPTLTLHIGCTISVTTGLFRSKIPSPKNGSISPHLIFRRRDLNFFQTDKF